MFNPGLNPDANLPRFAPLPARDREVSLLIAVSVFTHLVQDQAVRYLDELARVLRPDGVALASFFLFEKRYFPMLQDFQNALYVNDRDPTNAVIFDRDWLLDELANRDLGVKAAHPPPIRGHQWNLEIGLGPHTTRPGEDHGPFGRLPPPVPDLSRDSIGRN